MIDKLLSSPRLDAVRVDDRRRHFLQQAASTLLLAGTAPGSVLGRTGNVPAPPRALTKPQQEWLHWSVRQVVRAIRSGTVSAENYAAAIVAAGDAASSWNIYISRDPAALLEAAKALAAGDSARSLVGVPIIVKDNINTAALPTSAGTPGLRNNRPGTDAPLVRRLLAAGALLAGKANMHELSSGGTSNNGAFGAVANPWNPERVPGGSSGGTAAAVAGRLVPAGIGTDTAGSVRVPAALCGVVGFRPTVGRYPAEGIVPLSSSLDTAGPIARSVRDVALLDAVLADVGDQALRPASGPLRCGVATALVEAASDEVQAVVRSGLERLERADVELVDVDLSEILSLGKAAAVIDFEFPRLFRDYLAEYAEGISSEEVVAQIASPSVRGITQSRLAAEPDAAEYQRITQQVLPELRGKHAALHERHGLDALVFPTTPRVALPRAEDDHVLLDGEPVFSWFYFQNTAMASIAGNPSLSIPAGFSASKLPVGLSLDALPGADRRLLAVGLAVEEALAA